MERRLLHQQDRQRGALRGDQLDVRVVPPVGHVLRLSCGRPGWRQAAGGLVGIPEKQMAYARLDFAEGCHGPQGERPRVSKTTRTP